jgi:hypothetical protein
MPPVPDHSAELALLGCALLNGIVLLAAWRFASRRITASRSQAWLDAALLGYAVQYLSIGLPGLVGELRPATVVTTALILSAALLVMAGRRRLAISLLPPVDRGWVVGLATFAAAMVVGFAFVQADVPLTANDPLTYHFPAAVQWLQQGRIGLFPTWFFNPANTYSPLAGSTFIAWLMVPFGSDVLARFVQVPALLCAALGVYRLARQKASTPFAAAAVATAAVLLRPLFYASLTGKDDLFVTFFFVAALVSLAPDRASEPFAVVRTGLAVGLLLATKYTALLAVPMLLLAVDGPVRAGWRTRRWMTAVAVAMVVAGPWYLRNWIATGNPVFPLDVSLFGVHAFRGLFTTVRSDALSSVSADLQIVVGRGYTVPSGYTVPKAVACVATAAWVVCLFRFRRWASDPIRRACVLGPPIGLALFFWRSPFSELRFVFPAILMLLAANADVACFAVAAAVSALATITVIKGWVVFGPLAVAAVVTAAVAVAVDIWTRAGSRWRGRGVAVVLIISFGLFVYVRWTAFCERYPIQWGARDSEWSQLYRYEQPLWRFVNQHVPVDATVAYADLYFVYPLQGPALRRRVGYAPTRPGVHSLADLPWLGSGLPGEQIVQATDAATVADPDRETWLRNLRAMGARYLVVGRAVWGHTAIEASWAREDAQHFRPMYDEAAFGQVFAVDPPH